MVLTTLCLKVPSAHERMNSYVPTSPWDRGRKVGGGVLVYVVGRVVGG